MDSKRVDLKTTCGVYRIIWDEKSREKHKALMNKEGTPGLFIPAKKLGHYYIGSTSRNFYARWGEHQEAFRKGTHPNKYMQTLFDRYGMPSFEILSKTSPEESLKEEQRHLDFHFASRDLFPVDYGTFCNANRLAKGLIVAFAGSSLEDILAEAKASQEDSYSSSFWIKYPSGKMVVYKSLREAFSGFQAYWDGKYEVPFNELRDRLFGIKEWRGGFSGGECALKD